MSTFVKLQLFPFPLCTFCHPYIFLNIILWLHNASLALAYQKVSGYLEASINFLTRHMFKIYCLSLKNKEEEVWLQISSNVALGFASTMSYCITIMYLFTLIQSEPTKT